MEGDRIDAGHHLDVTAFARARARLPGGPRPAARPAPLRRRFTARNQVGPNGLRARAGAAAGRAASGGPPGLSRRRFTARNQVGPIPYLPASGVAAGYHAERRYLHARVIEQVGRGELIVRSVP